MSRLLADEPVTESEACAAIGLEADDLGKLIETGPFARPLTVRKVFGVAMVCTLGMLRRPEDALAIAISASRDARMKGKPRLLAVGWRHLVPHGSWLSDGVPANIDKGILVLPAEKWLSDIAECIARHRHLASGRPN